MCFRCPPRQRRQYSLPGPLFQIIERTKMCFKCAFRVVCFCSFPMCISIPQTLCWENCAHRMSSASQLRGVSFSNSKKRNRFFVQTSQRVLAKTLLNRIRRDPPGKFIAPLFLRITPCKFDPNLLVVDFEDSNSILQIWAGVCVRLGFFSGCS